MKLLFGDDTDSALFKLTSSDPVIRKLGAQSLLRLLPASRIVEIQHALAREPEPNVAKWLALTLGNLRDPSSITYLQEKRHAATNRDLIDWIDVSLSKLLPFDSLRSRDLFASSSTDTVREAAANCYKERRRASLFKRELLRAVEHPDSEVRRWAILSAATSGILSRSERIIHGLTDSNYLVREWTECGLAIIQDTASIPHLIYRLQDAEPRVREWAIKALAAFDDTDIPALLIGRFAGEDDIECKEAIIRALARWARLRPIQDFLRELLAAVYLPPLLLLAVIDVIVTNRAVADHPDLVPLLMGRPEFWQSQLLSSEVVSRLKSVLPRKQARALRKLHEHSAGQLMLQGIGQALSASHNERGGSVAISTCDIGIIIALREENDAIDDFVGTYTTDVDREHVATYRLFNIPSAETGRPFRCAAIVIGAMGTDRAGIYTDRLIARYSPRCIVNLGIAGALHDDLKLCDIVVGRQVDNYLAGAKAIGDTFVLAGDPFKADHFLTTMVSGLADNHRDDYNRISAAAAAEYEGAGAPAAELIRSELLRPTPRILEGNVASGPIVGESADFARWLLSSRDRSYKALEMESAGVVLATYLARTYRRSLIIRGISDFADDRKKRLDRIRNGVFRRIAVRNAYRLLTAALSHITHSDIA